MTDKTPGVKASGPTGTRLLTRADFADSGTSLFDRLFSARGTTPESHMTICGPIRKPREVQR